MSAELLRFGTNTVSPNINSESVPEDILATLRYPGGTWSDVYCSDTTPMRTIIGKILGVPGSDIFLPKNKRKIFTLFNISN